MSQVNINIRMDKKVKEQFYNFCDELGLTPSAAFNVFAKTTIREQKIPFELSISDPFYSESNLKIIEDSIKNRNDKNVVHKTLEELLALEEDN